MSILYCNIACIIRTLETIFVQEQCPTLRICFILENVFSIRPLLACTLFSMPALAFSVFPSPGHFCPCCCCCRKVGGCRKAHRWCTGDGTVGICLRTSGNFTGENVQWLANVGTALGSKYLNQPQSYFRQLFWTWFEHVTYRRSHTLSLSYIYAKRFKMTKGCKKLGSAGDILSHLTSVIWRKKHAKQLCTPGLFFHESTSFLFVRFTNKGKSTKILRMVSDFFHQRVLLALKLFLNVNLKRSQNELSIPLLLGNVIFNMFVHDYWEIFVVLFYLGKTQAKNYTPLLNWVLMRFPMPYVICEQRWNL